MHTIMRTSGVGARPGVIFDFDGTLVDSMGVWEQIDIDFFTKYGLPLKQEYAEVITALGFEGGAKFMKERFNIDRTEQEIVDEWNEMAIPHYANDVEFRPGALEFVKHLHDAGVPIGICTSNQESLVMSTLRHCDAEGYFSSITCSNDLGMEKIDPRAFAMAAEALGCAPSASVAFDDIAPCVRSAKQAGFGIVVGVYDGHVQQDTDALKAECDIYMESFEQLVPGSALYEQVLGELMAAF